VWCPRSSRNKFPAALKGLGFSRAARAEELGFVSG
jgi:hypothetical protein